MQLLNRLERSRRCTTSERLTSNDSSKMALSSFVSKWVRSWHQGAVPMPTILTTRDAPKKRVRWFCKNSNRKIPTSAHRNRKSRTHIAKFSKLYWLNSTCEALVCAHSLTLSAIVPSQPQVLAEILPWTTRLRQATKVVLHQEMQPQWQTLQSPWQWHRIKLTRSPLSILQRGWKAATDLRHSNHLIIGSRWPADNNDIYQSFKRNISQI